MAGRHLVLVGAGHAHLFSLKRCGEIVGRGHRVTVVAPGPFWYSGLATGMLGGDYPPELDQVDVAALTAKGGGDYRKGRLGGLDPASRTLILEDGSRIAYDVLSLTLGSLPPPLPGLDTTADCYAVKPVEQVRALRQALERRIAADRSRPVAVAVAGGGATALELAANIVGLAARRGGRAQVTLVGGRGPLLRQMPERAAAAAVADLERRGVRIRSGVRVARVEPGTAWLDSGEGIPFDLFVNATGLHPNPILKATGLPLDAVGNLEVDAHLRCPGFPEIHGAGDCVAVAGHDLPKVGVYAIRQGPILFHNLLAALEGRPPRHFVPQSRYLWIMNLGNRCGLAAYGGLWWKGRSAWWLKDRIDRRFLREYQEAAVDARAQISTP